MCAFDMVIFNISICSGGSRGFQGLPVTLILEGKLSTIWLKNSKHAQYFTGRNTQIALFNANYLLCKTLIY